MKNVFQQNCSAMSMCKWEYHFFGDKVTLIHRMYCSKQGDNFLCLSMEWSSWSKLMRCSMHEIGSCCSHVWYVVSGRAIWRIMFHHFHSNVLTPRTMECEITTECGAPYLHFYLDQNKPRSNFTFDTNRLTRYFTVTHLNSDRLNDGQNELQPILPIIRWHNVKQ